MTFTDKTLTCVDCGAEFVFTAGEQEFHAQKGFQNPPRRCPACRAARRGGEPRSDMRPARELFSATCGRCGKEAKVPFEPRNDRPVYCNDCYRAQGGGGGGGLSRGGGGGAGGAGGYGRGGPGGGGGRGPSRSGPARRW